MTNIKVGKEAFEYETKYGEIIFDRIGTAVALMWMLGTSNDAIRVKLIDRPRSAEGSTAPITTIAGSRHEAIAWVAKQGVL